MFSLVRNDWFFRLQRRLVLAEGIAHKLVPMCLDQFWRTGLEDEALAPRFRQVVADSVRLRPIPTSWCGRVRQTASARFRRGGFCW
ncbi:MAG: hypothetical protein ACN6PE_05145 [Achromobacter marplatensis]|uniref:hypothetical protein n=1 Tax=Achromobacter marplatensis TaxID=470868 RepID=UPI003D02A63D